MQVRVRCVLSGIAATILAAAAVAEPVNVGLIEINESPGERPAPMAHLLGDEADPTLRDLVGKLHEAAEDESIDAVVLRLRDASLSTTQVEELSAAMAKVRKAGKKIHVFADLYGTSELMLAAAADEAIIQKGGAVSFPGLYMEEMYLADTLNWVGITPDFVQVGDYKGASEPMARSSPSPQWEQNISQLLDSLYANVRAPLKTGRRLDDGQLDEAMRKAFLADGDMAKEVGLIDATLDLPDLEDHLASAYGEEIEWTNLTEPDDGAASMDMSNPFAMIGKLMFSPAPRPKRDTIAVLHIDGPIVDGESTSGGLFGGQSVGSHTIRRTLSELHDNDKIKGVILRINSPGGSAIASEIIWQGVQRVSKDKPVWVSVGSMAASGGYYIAVAGEKIYVDPSSIVGSIGVVGGKLAMGGLYDKVKLNVVPRSRGPMGSLFSSAEPWTEAERALIRQRMTETYDLFTKRVVSGREGIDLSKTAEGRLFTGNVAVTNKMADEIGGLSEVIRAMADKQGLAEDQYDVFDYPPAPGLGEMLESIFGQMASAEAGAGTQTPQAVVAALREIVGPDAWPAVRDNVAAIMQMRREKVLLISPRALIFK